MMRTFETSIADSPFILGYWNTCCQTRQPYLLIIEEWGMFEVELDPFSTGNQSL